MGFEIKIISDNTNEVEYEAFYEKIKKLTYEFHKDKIQRIWLETSFKAEPAPVVGKRVPFDRVFGTRSEAEEILDLLQKEIDAYGHATLGDLKGLLNVTVNHSDYAWGWLSMHGTHIRRVGGDYVIDYPPIRQI